MVYILMIGVPACFLLLVLFKMLAGRNKAMKRLQNALDAQSQPIEAGGFCSIIGAGTAVAGAWALTDTAFAYEASNNKGDVPAYSVRLCDIGKVEMAGSAIVLHEKSGDTYTFAEQHLKLYPLLTQALSGQNQQS